MSFSNEIVVKALTACNRSCCICHKFSGTKMELHHIRQVADGGSDTFENCIPLCLSCHADMGKADPKHPKGKHYSEKELVEHRDKWYRMCELTPSNFPSEQVSADEIELFQRICSHFTDTIRIWLTEKPLAGLIPMGAFDPLFDMDIAYKSPFDTFLCTSLEQERLSLFNAVDEFLSYLSTNTFPHTISGNSFSATRIWLFHHDNSDSLPLSHFSSYEEEADTLVKLARSVWDKYVSFVSCGRSLIHQTKSQH